MAFAPGNNKIYKNKVFIGIFKSLTLLIIRRYFGDINKEDGIKGN